MQTTNATCDAKNNPFKCFFKKQILYEQTFEFYYYFLFYIEIYMVKIIRIKLMCYIYYEIELSCTRVL